MEIVCIWLVYFMIFDNISRLCFFEESDFHNVTILGVGDS